MNDDGMDMVLLALMLILPLSALIARRLPLGVTLRMALVWGAIFGALFALVALW